MNEHDATEWFAVKMRERMELHEHFDNYYDKYGDLVDRIDGWMKSETGFEYLLTKMAEHCGEINCLMRLMVNGGGKEKLIVVEDDIDQLVKQCADCANFAMMIADRACRRKKQYKQPLKGFAVD